MDQVEPVVVVVDQSAEVEEKTETDELKCRWCKGICSDPLSLHCFHPICSRCLTDLPEQIEQIECSQCQIITRFSADRSSLFRNDLLRNRIEKHLMNEGEIRCNSCSSNDRSISHCSTCSSYLCLQCSQAHSMMKCFEHHRVRSILPSPNTKEKNNNVEKDDENEAEERERTRQRIDDQFESIGKDETRLAELLTEERNERRRHFQRIEEQFKEQTKRFIEHLQQFFDRCQTDLKSVETTREKEFDEQVKEFVNGQRIVARMKCLRQSMEKDEEGKKDPLLPLDERRSFEENFLLPQLDRMSNFFQRLATTKTKEKDDELRPIVELKFVSLETFDQWINRHLCRIDEPTNEQKDEEQNPGTEKIGTPIPPPQQQQQQQQQLDEEEKKKKSEHRVAGRTSISSPPDHFVFPSSQSDPLFVNYPSTTTMTTTAEQEDDPPPLPHAHEDEFQPVEENLRALESIFAHQLSEVTPPFQPIFSPNPNHPNHYSILTRQTSAPPLSQERSPTSNYLGYAPPSLLGTYSTTNSGGSSNGNNSRSTTPYSSTLNPSSSSLELFSQNVSHSSVSHPARRTGQSMQIRTKFGSLGPQKCQFNAPHGFCLGIDEEIIVADTNNHRIQIFEKNGEYKYQFGIPGKEEGQLWYPRKVAVIRQSAKFVVCDRGNERSRMQIFTRQGIFIKKISIRYIDIVAGLAISQQGNIVAVDSVSPTVFCISENGDLLKWFDCSDYMREPSDLSIFNDEYFVCDFKGHCVVVFDEEGTFLRRIGSESITNFPNGIDISDAGDVIIGDSHGNRFHIAVYNRQGDFLQEFDCPYVKVSRCCGLKITSDGFIVTLAKNNHHVLVLNTLYLS